INQRKDGTTFSTEISVRLIEVEGRKFVQSIVRDITERKRAEEQIQRLNRLYLLLSRLGLAIIHSQTDADLFAAVCTIAVNHGGFRLAAIGMVEPETKRIKKVAGAGEAVDYLQDAPMTAADGTYGDGPAGRSIREGRAVLSDDISCDPAMAAWRDAAARFGLRSSISLPLRRGGQIIGQLGLYSAEAGFFNEEEVGLAEEMAASVSYALDVLEQDRQRRQAETELRISEERLELILDATSEGYWDRDLATGSGHLSPRYEEMLGYQPGELPADFESWRALVHPEDVSTMLAALSAVKQPGQGVCSADVRMRRKTGQYIWVSWRAKVVARDAQGAPTRIVGTHTDITERKQLQEELLQAQKLESVGRLAGGVAHDFNNLLTVINGYSDLALQRLDEGHPLRRPIDQIRKAGATAARLTEQLLAFSRRQVIEPKIIDLNAVIAATAPMLGPLLGASIELVVNPDPLAATVMADSSQMKQVIMNLAVNARDAMPDGGVFRLTTRHAEINASHCARNGDADPGSYVVLEASDTGTGMEENTKRLIFEPFFTTKPEGHGTGLGLSTAYGIVKQGHGWIEVDSEVDCGSTFTIYLPRAVGSVAPSAAEQTSPVDSAGSETVLVVEDQDNVRKLVTEVVAASKYHVLEASSGDEALTLAQHYRGPIHILVTDMAMPRMGGRELAEKLTARRPDTRVLFMTAHADEILRRERPVDGTDLILKPFGPEALVQKIREVLDRGKHLIQA
ncbi:MAG TPA: PAS domain S-box protein, partial [Bryobacteraceae bacterium]|nr:PAS domain S-box protein [Bryobacteraceae bacterium]